MVLEHEKLAATSDAYHRKQEVMGVVIVILLILVIIAETVVILCWLFIDASLYCQALPSNSQQNTAASEKVSSRNFVSMSVFSSQRCSELMAWLHHYSLEILQFQQLMSLNVCMSCFNGRTLLLQVVIWNFAADQRSSLRKRMKRSSRRRCRPSNLISGGGKCSTSCHTTQGRIWPTI